MRYLSAEEALQPIQNGDHIHWPCVSAVPEHLVKALVERVSYNTLKDIHISHFYTEGYSDYTLPEYQGLIHLDSFFVGANVRKATNEGRAGTIPCSLSEVPRMIESGAIRSDVVLLMVSEPDENGYVSLGTSCDYMREAMKAARYIVAQVNRYVPYTYGDTKINISEIDAFVHYDQPLNEAGSMPLSETDKMIGRHTAELIPDGATLQVGIGNIPSAVLAQLKDHKHLGIHSEMISDDVVDLYNTGAIDGSKKKTDPGKMVAMFLKGSSKLYNYVDHNKEVMINSVAYTNNPFNIAQNPNVIALNSAIEIDLTGQVCADSIGTKIFSGSGGQLDFMIGATYSEGGKPIIAMPSITGKGASKIVPTLTQGAGVVTPRTLTQWVVTEQGAVNLYAKPIHERARLLISIAHPSQQETLERQARELGIL
ncbi:MAG: 4-hydroxybutyrate CoA-transferase [Bacteroidales bacterium]|nr:4-hydroxybutyrate CoA-transferase [Bacteroidales bacterium]